MFISSWSVRVIGCMMNVDRNLRSVRKIVMIGFRFGRISVFLKYFSLCCLMLV